MENLLNYKELGIVGLVVLVLGLIVWKVVNYFLQSKERSDKFFFENAQNLTNATTKLSDNVNNGNILIVQKIVEVQKGVETVLTELNDIVKQDAMMQNHQEVISKVDLIYKQLNEILKHEK